MGIKMYAHIHTYNVGEIIIFQKYIIKGHPDGGARHAYLQLCVPMSECAHIYAYIYTHIYNIHIHIHTYVCINMNREPVYSKYAYKLDAMIDTHMRIDRHVYMHTDTYVGTHIQVHMCTHTYTPTCIYTHTSVYIHLNA